MNWRHQLPVAYKSNRVIVWVGYSRWRYGSRGSCTPAKFTTTSVTVVENCPPISCNSIMDWLMKISLQPPLAEIRTGAASSWWRLTGFIRSTFVYWMTFQGYSYSRGRSAITVTKYTVIFYVIKPKYACTLWRTYSFLYIHTPNVIGCISHKNATLKCMQITPPRSVALTQSCYHKAIIVRWLRTMWKIFTTPKSETWIQLQMLFGCLCERITKSLFKNIIIKQYSTKCTQITT